MALDSGWAVEMLAPLTHFLPNTLIRRERVLPRPGRVVVRSGQMINALDIIAETFITSDYQLLDIGQILGISSARSDRSLQCQAGDQLAQGDLIAGPIGISNRVVRAPKDCRVVFAGEGQVLLEPLGKPFQLKAGIPGEVIALIPDRGAVIETTGALVQAVWGNGRIDSGVMTVISRQPDQYLTLAEMDVSLRGSIVLSGICEDAETLKFAEELPLRGLILASIDANLLPIASQLRIPIVLIEGFGAIPMNSVAYKLLSTSDRREVALNAESWNPYTSSRPEIVIPLPSPVSAVAPQEIGAFSSKSRVRALSLPYQGKIGTIVKLINSASFPGGLRAPGAEIKFENDQTAILPLANLEMII